ncbi:MAG: hypothetical protein ACTSPA_08335 [Promethearchaeota archaeon]
MFQILKKKNNGMIYVLQHLEWKKLKMKLVVFGVDDLNSVMYI